MEEGANLPAAGVVVLQKSGLGIETKPPLDPFGVWHRSYRRNQVPGQQWFSPLAYYLGPFDDQHGLDGSIAFYRRTSINNKPPQIYLTATEEGLGIVPTQNWLMARGRGRASTLRIAYGEIATVRLDPATKDRMSVILPNTAHQLGQVVVTTSSHRKATLSGTTVSGLSALLQALGAQIQQ